MLAPKTLAKATAVCTASPESSEKSVGTRIFFTARGSMMLTT